MVILTDTFTKYVLELLICRETTYCGFYTFFLTAAIISYWQPVKHLQNSSNQKKKKVNG